MTSNNHKHDMISPVSKLESIELNLEALLSVPSVIGFDISTDGKIVFASNKSGQFQLYLGKLTSDGVEDCDQITFDEESKVSPKFSPDSSKILYASDVRGDEKFNLYLYDSGTKKVDRLTGSSDFSIYPKRHFRKTERKSHTFQTNRKNSQTYTFDLETGHSSRISYHAFSDDYATISPNARWIAYSSNVKAQEIGIFVASLENPSRGVIRLEEEGFPD